MNYNLNEKIVVVTGGGSGIGEAISKAFAFERSDVVVADVNKEAANHVAVELKKDGYNAIGINTDVSVKKDADSLIKFALEKFNRIDVLINNAGISPKKDGGDPEVTWELSEDEWNTVMDVNLKGTLFCSQAALKDMLSRKSGAIVNIASIAGKAPYEPMATGAHYDASKAGIINLTQRLASEVAHLGIRVNAVAPGRIATPLAKFASGKWNDAMLQRTLMGRFGTPMEVANAVVFLASNAASFITGETLNVNGGWLMD